MNREPVQQTDQFSNRESVNRGPTDLTDEKVMSLMNALYSAEMTLDEFIQTVEKLIVSEKAVFERLIQFISDEIRYVGKYPSNDTRITAEIVGMMLNRGFFMRVGPRDVSGPTPGVAPFALIMRGMVEALRRPPTTKLFRFGVIIVEQVLGRIIRWPQLCGAILQISTFKATYPLYFEYIESALQFVPEEKRMLPLLDEAECMRIFAAGGIGNVPDVYPFPLAEKDEREMHSLKIDAFRRGVASAAVPPPVAVVSAPLPAVAGVDQLLNDPSILEGINVPADWFQEQTATLFNILCVANLEEKITETRQVLEANKQWISWFGFYLVKNRVSKETNQHAIYLSFIDGLKVSSSPSLLDAVTSSTFGCLRVLLGALETLAPSSAATHRSVLKNLGSWLGQITVARNKVIKTKDLDLKQLLLESFEKGRLTTTLPLVCRVMSSVTESRVFKPPNPWTTGILSVLGELHDLSNLRTNLVFEIEILFKRLDIALADIKRSELLQNRTYPADSQDFGPAAPMSQQAVPMSQQAVPMIQQQPPSQPSQLSQLTQQLKQLQANWMSGTASNAAAVTASAALNRPVPIGGAMRPAVLLPPPPPPPPPAAGLTFADTLSFPNLAMLVSIPPSVALFQIQPKLRPLVPLAVERAIREIVNAVAERSVTISCLTAREIVLKDFACEPDESVVRKSAQLMVGCLAGSLALVTCREPFRAALSSHLKSMLMPMPVDQNEQALVEQVVSVITAENIDLGCVLMERAVYERATREVCETVSLAIQARRLHREQQSILASSSGGHYTATPFVDTVHGMYLLPNSNLKTQHLSVYREFRDLMVRMETTDSSLLGPHPGLINSPMQAPMQAPMLSPPPPPSGIPSLVQVQQLLLSLRTQAESQSSPNLGELKQNLLSMNELVIKLACNECLVTLPEIVDSQPFQLDSYYGLISLGFQAEWLEFLRKIQALLASDSSLIVPTVWALTSAISERFDKLAALSIPLALPTDELQAQKLARVVGSAVTEEHLFVELALAVFSLLPAGSLHTPIMAWILEMLFTKLKDHSSDQVKSAMLSIVLGVLRYNLTKESEMDRMLAKLLTDHRTIGTTGFVVYLLQTFTCRMRMSPLSNWPVTTEVIYKMLQRVTAAGALIPANEKCLAAQLDGFAREMKAVANVSPERIAAYRQLHCLGVRPPEPLPWDIVANQALVLTKLSLGTVNVPLTADRRLFFAQLASVSSMDQIWVRLRQAGCELDVPGPAGPTIALPEWTEGFFRTIVSDANISVDSGIHLMMAVCSRSDLIGHEQRPMDVLRCRYIRKMWDTIARELLGKTDGSKFGKILAQTLHEALKLGSSGPFSNAVLSHFAKILFAVGPQNVPLFTFSWFELIAHRDFMPLVLGGMKGQRGWWGYMQILQQGFGFVAAAIDQSSASEGGPTSVLVEGMTKLLEVLSIDFPEFLSKFADELVHDIHPSCIRARNILLAALPRGLAVPNPFIVSPIASAQVPPLLTARVALAEAAQQKWGAKFASQDSKQVQAFLHSSLSSLNSVFQASAPAVRTALVCGLLNLLRCPSRQTEMYVGAAQQLFVKMDSRNKEELTRAMVERLTVTRPHPWGLLVLFSQFVQNPEFSFWNQTCLKSSELEKSVKSLALLCFPEPPAAGPSAMLQKVVESQRRHQGE